MMSAAWRMLPQRSLLRIPALPAHLSRYRTRQAGAGRVPFDELEKIEDMLNAAPSQITERVIREEERKHKQLIYHIMKRKHFKPTQEVNLLTWDAKEQIRYLHAEDPENWTPEQLANSFPISWEGVCHLLKSKFVPRTWEELIRHDRRVQKQWKMLQAAGSTRGGHPLQLYAGRWKYAAGNEDLPKPSSFLPVYTPPWRQSNRPVGLFESIVKDYCDKVSTEKEEQAKRQKSAEELHQVKSENIRLLGEMDAAFKPSKSSKAKFNQKNNEVKPVASSSFEFQDPVLSPVEHDTNDAIATMLPEVDMADELLMAPVRRGPRRGIVRNKVDHSRPLEELQMKDTGNVGIHSDRLAEETTRESPDTLYVKRQKAVLDSVRYDKPVNSDVEVGYIYDNQRGYQHPFGQVDKGVADMEGKPPTSPASQGSGLLKKGDSYYDEDGEFLFRVP